MKCYIKYFLSSIVLLIILGITGCKENGDLTIFDTSNSYVYFALKSPESRANKIKYTDTLQYSFAFEDVSVVKKQLKIPINLSGIATNFDRSIQVKINEEKSSAPKYIYKVSEAKIGANRVSDTLIIELDKLPELMDTTYTLQLDLVPNNDFQLGDFPNRSLHISFSNILSQPKWWRTWQSYFGAYKPEVYQQWIQIYKEGLDPTPEWGNSKNAYFYYWNNMPPNTLSFLFPVTFSFIEVLRNYFIENPTYPNGDTSKPRIYIN